MAEYICVERKAIHKIPDSVPLDVAALVEPLAVAWHAVKLGKMEATDTALVLGAGKQTHPFWNSLHFGSVNFGTT